MDPQTMGEETFSQEKINLFKRVFDVMFGRKEQATEPFVSTGFKTLASHGLPDYFIATYTNPYEDREGEHFAEKAIDVDIAYMLVSEDYPELWYRHLEGTKHGEVKWVGKIGRFAVAVGQFDDTPMAEKFKAYYDGLGEIGVSHGYLYPESKLDGGAYYLFHTTEISTLEPEIAANPYAGLYIGAKEMNKVPKQLSLGDITALQKILGDDLTQEVMDFYEQRSKNLDGAGVSRKDADVPAATPAPAPQAAPTPAVTQEPEPEEETQETTPAWAQALIDEQKSVGEGIKALVTLLSTQVTQGKKQNDNTPEGFLNPRTEALKREAGEMIGGTKNIQDIDPIMAFLDGFVQAQK